MGTVMVQANTLLLLMIPNAMGAESALSCAQIVRFNWKRFLSI